ncbi:tumor protein p63-regulated gene 1-like protein [Hydra vulgaris]|uniref:Tumor protein p63-regulated gene 1-like protein n=1 Tax=Hydra vulgaris TaxID=6087 RepID=A0ABM4C2W0_HYDVU
MNVGERENSPCLTSDTSFQVSLADAKNKVWWKFYIMRPGLFEQAVSIISANLNKDRDGVYQSAWALAELDHWDMENERIVVLTDSNMVVVKFNFSGMCIESWRIFKLRQIDGVQTGPFVYPKRNVTTARAHQSGVRISWNKKEVLSLWQRFSPLFNSPSYVTFSEHKAASQLNSCPPYMNLQEFKKAVILASQTSGALFEGVDGPIYLEVYIGAASMIHNSPDLGYSMERVIAAF